MSATVNFSESNGVGEDITDDISNANLGSADAPNLNTTIYYIIRGQNSFSKYIRAKFTGVWTTISNMKFWKSEGTYKTNEVIKASANAVYATPSQIDTGDSNIPTEEGSALALNSAEGEATIEYGATEVSGYTGYIRLQLQTSVSTETGAVNQKTFCLQYDVI